MTIQTLTEQIARLNAFLNAHSCTDEENNAIGTIIDKAEVELSHLVPQNNEELAMQLRWLRDTLRDRAWPEPYPEDRNCIRLLDNILLAVESCNSLFATVTVRHTVAA